MLILGHRGVPREAPENTITSFQRAMQQGADGVELDVQRAADGTPVVIHDSSLERTTSSRGLVAALSWPDISAVRAGSEPIPSLRQAIRWARSAGAFLNVEIKAAEVEEAVLAELSEGGLLERSIISSFDPQIVRNIGALSPPATRFLLTERWDEAAEENLACSDARGVCLHVDSATPSVLAQMRDDGLPVVVWTVNEPLRIRELMRAGVHGIISDTPAVAVEIARELGLR